MKYSGLTELKIRLSEAVKIAPRVGTVEIGIKCNGEFDMQSLPQRHGTWTPRYHTLAELQMPHGGMARMSISHGGSWRKLEIRLSESNAESYYFANALYDLFDELRKREGYLPAEA